MELVRENKKGLSKEWALKKGDICDKNPASCDSVYARWLAEQS